MSHHEDELRGFLDSDQVVSYRWFAALLDIHVEEAKQIMTKFKEANTETTATYCVTGVLRGTGERVCSVVGEKALEASKRKLEDNCHVHIYSLQKTGPSRNLSTLLSSIDNQQAVEFVAQKSCDSFLRNTMGGVKMDKCEVKAAGQRAPSSTNILNRESSSAPQSAPSEAKLFQGLSKASVDSGASSSASLKAKKSAPPAAVSNFFAASAAKASKPSEAASATTDSAKWSASKVETAVEPSKGPAVSAPVRNADDGNDSDGEWNDGSGYKTDKSRLRDRKVAHGTPMEVDEGGEADCPVEGDGEGAEGEAEVEGEGGSPAEKKGRKTSNGKKNVIVRGAMDDYFEDVAIENFKAEQAASAGAGAGAGGDAGAGAGGGETSEPVKKKKKKLVEKMFADAKGYLVTEMVWEEVTDDEADAPPPAPASHQAAAKRSNPVSDEKENGGNKGAGGSQAQSQAAKKTKKPAAAPAAGGAAQKSMMSFFTKKA